MSPRICILCGNAAHNRGDRANLSAQIALLKRSFPDAEISVCSDRAEVDAAWYGVTVVPRGMPVSLSLLKELRKADVVIWGGGALIADNAGRLLIPYWLTLIALIKYALKKPIIAWAQGLVITTRTGALLGSWALKCADIVTVRDEGSLKTAQRIGIRNAIKTADPAILFEPENAETGQAILKRIGLPVGTRLIAVTPTFWQHYHRPKDLLPYAIARRWGFRKNRGEEEINALIRSLARTIDLIKEEADAHILLLPRYASAPWPDCRFLERIRTECKAPASVTVFTEDLPPTTYFSIFRQTDCVLSVALHDAVVAAGLNVPVVQIVYEEKGADFARCIGSDDLTIPLAEFVEESGPATAAQLVMRALREWPDRKEMHRQKIDALRAMAKENATHLARLL